MIPLRISDTLERVPWMNWLLIAATTAISIWFYTHPDLEHLARYFVYSEKYPLSILGSMFVHADYVHLFGNMLFLWVFGNGVCSMLGNFTYGGLYVFLGVMAGLVHKFADGRPAVGASGAIFGVVGLAVAIFPFARVTLLHFFMLFPRLWKVPLWGIALYWTLLDLGRAYAGGGQIASWAHLGGFNVGLLLGLGLLAIGYVRLTEYDDASLWEIIRRQNRRPAKARAAGFARFAAPPVPQPNAGPETSAPVERRKLKLRVGAGAAAREAAGAEPVTATEESAPRSAAVAETPTTGVAETNAAEVSAPLPVLALPKRAETPAPTAAPAVRSRLKLAGETAVEAPAAVAPANAEAEATPNAAPVAAAIPADFFLFDGASRLGPMTAEEAQQKIRAAGDTTNWLYWQQGMSGWQPVQRTMETSSPRVSSPAPAGMPAMGSA